MYAFFLSRRNGNLPVSFIQKYLVKKLDLTSEAEVSLFSFLSQSKILEILLKIKVFVSVVCDGMECSLIKYIS